MFILRFLEPYAIGSPLQNRCRGLFFCLQPNPIRHDALPRTDAVNNNAIEIKYYIYENIFKKIFQSRIIKLTWPFFIYPFFI